MYRARRVPAIGNVTIGTARGPRGAQPGTPRVPSTGSLRTRGVLTIGGRQGLALIAGPCVIDGEARTFSIARKLKDIAAELDVPFIFKASYAKANRLSARSYRGPGLEKGLQILKRIKEQLGLLVLSDVHSAAEAEPAAKVLDVIQIPALLCRQTDIVEAAARTGVPLNIKKGQFMAPWDMANVVEKARLAGAKRVLVTERGSCFGYNNLIADMRSIPELKKLGCPVLFDAGHSSQFPGGRGSSSGGQREMVPILARAAVAAGCDGIFLEVHDKPEQAKSDSATLLPLEELPGLLKQLQRIHAAIELEES